MVRSCQQGLVMVLRRRRLRIFQERKNVLEMFDDEQLIKRLHFLSYSNRKRAKYIYITKEHQHFYLHSSHLQQLYESYLQQVLIALDAICTNFMKAICNKC